MNLTKLTKEKKPLFKRNWLKNIGLVVIGFVVGGFIFSPSQTETAQIKDYPRLATKYNNLLDEHDKLVLDTRDWLELSSAEKHKKLEESRIEAEKLELEKEKREKEETQNELEKERKIAEGTKVYEDKSVKINFKEIDNQGIVYLVENKTNKSLTFQAESLSVNGTSTNDFTMSDSVAPKSTGKIIARTSEYSGIEAEKVSGKMSVIDFDSMDYHDISFTDVDVRID